jgi:hypothetical protein
MMALKEVPMKEGEQLMFRAIELGEVVREIDATEQQKKEMTDEYNTRIKLLKKRMVKLAYEMKE